MNEEKPRSRPTYSALAALAFILAAGIFLRVYPSAGFKSIGFDEHVYAGYARDAAKIGLTNYADLVREFADIQKEKHDAIAPPTRVAFIAPAALLVQAAHVDPMRAVRMVSATAAILLLCVTAGIAYRWGNSAQMLIVTALMAVAPLQIALAQRALGDGCFALWAIICAWCFFETLLAPASPSVGGQDRPSRFWLCALGFSFFMLVLTKESAAFVCAALLMSYAALVAARVVPVTLKPVSIMAASGAAAVIIIASLLGGFGEFFAFYRAYAAKSSVIPYVIQFQDGAWYRYLVDFTLMSPVIVALVFARALNLGPASPSSAAASKESRADLFWALFLGFSFVAMSLVRYGMSLRFAAYWDEPLRWLAASQVVIMGNRFAPRWRNPVMIAAVVALLIVDLAQYQRFFIKAGIYDPVSYHLLRASYLVK
jgi:4-amino-4-deoxy-L-arabinose transferase-like glycosyltransferase